MGEPRPLLWITLGVGGLLDWLLFSLTVQLWRVTVHDVISDAMVGAGWPEKLLWVTLDLTFAGVIILGIGIVLAFAIVYPIYYRLTGRR